MGFTNIFSHFVGCLFTLLIVCFDGLFCPDNAVKFFTCFFPKNFSFTFSASSLTRCEFVSAFAGRWGPCLIFWPVETGSHHHLWKRLSRTELSSQFCPSSRDRMCMGSVLGNLFSYIGIPVCVHGSAYGFDFCSFRVTFEIKKCESPDFVLLLRHAVFMTLKITSLFHILFVRWQSVSQTLIQGAGTPQEVSPEVAVTGALLEAAYHKTLLFTEHLLRFRRHHSSVTHSLRNHKVGAHEASPQRATALIFWFTDYFVQKL